MQFESNAKSSIPFYKKAWGKKFDEVIKGMPNFSSKYQTWYSESLAVIKVLLPDRVGNFISYYEKPKGRKEVLFGNYVIEDYLQGLTVTRNGREIVSKSAAIPQFQQQLNILKSVQGRFVSTLFDIKQIVQADLFDSELNSARELLKHKYFRAAGAIASVVLEKHLTQVLLNHDIALSKKNSTIKDFNELLKNSEVIDVPQWRFIQLLGDLRNLRSYKKVKDPGQNEVQDLITGVEKIIKTIF